MPTKHETWINSMKSNKKISQITMYNIGYLKLYLSINKQDKPNSIKNY